MLSLITDDLVADLDGLTFGPPVTHVYNPLIYARAAWDLYCERYGQGQREVLMIGMDPGPPGLSIPSEAFRLGGRRLRSARPPEPQRASHWRVPDAQT